VHAQTFPGLEQEDFAEQSGETSQEHDAKLFSTFNLSFQMKTTHSFHHLLNL
jgi:hypothetical protein